MEESSQEKLSLWWHNEYNRFVFFADNLKKITDQGWIVSFCPAEDQVGCTIEHPDDEGLCGFASTSHSLIDAFFNAKDRWDLRPNE